MDGEHSERDLIADLVRQRTELNRRRFMSMAGGAVALTLGGGLLAACGGDDDDDESATKQLTKGTIALGGYPDWIGSDNLADFAKASPATACDRWRSLWTRTGSPSSRRIRRPWTSC